jgi:hypothetical protein
MPVILLPGELYPEWREHFSPAGAMQRFAIEQHAVEIEKDGVIAGHQEGISE